MIGNVRKSPAAWARYRARAATRLSAQGFAHRTDAVKRGNHGKRG